jgi:hypothetical protein
VKLRTNPLSNEACLVCEAHVHAQVACAFVCRRVCACETTLRALSLAGGCMKAWKVAAQVAPLGSSWMRCITSGLSAAGRAHVKDCNSSVGERGEPDYLRLRAQRGRRAQSLQLAWRRKHGPGHRWKVLAVAPRSWNYAHGV